MVEDKTKTKTSGSLAELDLIVKDGTKTKAAGVLKLIRNGQRTAANQCAEKVKKEAAAQAAFIALEKRLDTAYNEGNVDEITSIERTLYDINY